jgi:hypothetical protein
MMNIFGHSLDGNVGLDTSVQVGLTEAVSLVLSPLLFFNFAFV